MNGERQMLGTSKMKFKKVISIYLMRSKRMTEKEEEKNYFANSLQILYILHILHVVPIYCPQNTNLQKVNRIVLLCSFYLQYHPTRVVETLGFFEGREERNPRGCAVVVFFLSFFLFSSSVCIDTITMLPNTGVLINISTKAFMRGSKIQTLKPLCTCEWKKRISIKSPPSL